MVFCLCGRRCFSKTLVITEYSKGQYKSQDVDHKRPTYSNLFSTDLNNTIRNPLAIRNIQTNQDDPRPPVVDHSTSREENDDSQPPSPRNPSKSFDEQRSPSPNYPSRPFKPDDPRPPVVDHSTSRDVNNDPTPPSLRNPSKLFDEQLSPSPNYSSRPFKHDDPRSPATASSPDLSEDIHPQSPILVKPPKTVSGGTNSRKNKAPPIPVEIIDPQAELRNHSNASEDFIDSPKLSQNNELSNLDKENVEPERRDGVAVRVDGNMDEKLPHFDKDPRDEELIRKSIQNNEFLHKIISKEQLDGVISAMYSKDVSANQTIIKQGDKGKHMYISASGTFQVIIKGKLVEEFKDSRVFGEIAILHKTRRLASIKAVTVGRVWVLDSRVYQQISIRSAIKQEDEIKEFLLNNKILNVVGKDALQIVSTLLKTEFYNSGDKIIKEGDRGDKFFIIRAGTVTITTEKEGIVNVYKKGDCFGELALLEEDCRKATITANAPGVECLTLTRKEFIDHFGEIKTFKYIKVKDKPKDSIKSVHTEFDDINLKDLKIIKTIGVGGFGRVELVQHTRNENVVFALKYLKKVEIVQQHQQEHVFNEKDIQMSCRSPFIARLFRTYKDRKYVYFLMECCLGGDLWSLLQRHKSRRFDDKEAKFICGCVILAFEYLHGKGIIYRDLKPENLLITANGYIKLTDFGFAKKIKGRTKTYTFAGTPEYVAPEIVLNRGHDKAVDYWAYGVFVYEMLTGKTPFRTDDSTHMKTYNKILSGIDSIEFPTYIGLKARQLVEKLCRPVPSERLGMQKNGIQDIKHHKWFGGMDWQKFASLDTPSLFKPKLTGPADTKYFDSFKRDIDNPPDELSGWDEKF